MNKLSRIVVKDMMVLSNEEMAMINGGDESTSSTTSSTNYCSPSQVQQACSYTYNGGTYNGTCTLIEIIYTGYESTKYICK